MPLGEDEMLEAVRSILPGGWEIEEGFGLDFNLICPHGDTIEQDGKCAQGCISPLRTMGMI